LYLETVFTGSYTNPPLGHPLIKLYNTNGLDQVVFAIFFVTFSVAIHGVMIHNSLNAVMVAILGE